MSTPILSNSQIVFDRKYLNNLKELPEYWIFYKSGFKPDRLEELPENHFLYVNHENGGMGFVDKETGDILIRKLIDPVKGIVLNVDVLSMLVNANRRRRQLALRVLYN